MFRPASLSPRYRSEFDIEQIDTSLKKHHGDSDDDDNDHDSKGGRRIKLLEHALKRRADELKNLQQAFTESLDGKRPLDPPTQSGPRFNELGFIRWTHMIIEINWNSSSIVPRWG
ncbi:hypothetical protein BGZ68_006671 [Mortierella alpina]|nr:hypothetical protein BGZ68_006671 [Mortierella alpina]